jgi:hypothetical protein
MQRLFSLTLAALLGAAGSAAQAQIKVPLSNPSRPVTLEMKIGMGDIHVKAYDGKEVLVAADDDDDNNGFNSNNNDNGNNREREGLHRIPNTSAGLTVEENDNVVTVVTDFSRHHSDLTVSVPRQTSVHVKTMGGNGDLTVTGVTGEHELSNINGDMRATDISGTIVAATNNGDIDVSMTAITAGKALSFPVQRRHRGDVAGDREGGRDHNQLAGRRLDRLRRHDAAAAARRRERKRRRPLSGEDAARDARHDRRRRARAALQDVQRRHHAAQAQMMCARSYSWRITTAGLSRAARHVWLPTASQAIVTVTTSETTNGSSVMGIGFRNCLR